MSKSATKMQWALRSLAGIFGTALLIYLIRRVGYERIAENIATVGWGLALVIALSGVSHVVKTLAWRITLTGSVGRISLLRMFKLRVASEAVGQVGVLGYVFGEGLRISAYDPSIPIDSRISSVILDRALFIITGAIVSVAGIAAALLVLSLTHALRLYAALFAVVLIALLLAIALAIVNRWSVLSRPARALAQVGYLRNKVESKLPLVHSVETKLFDFHRHSPGAFWASFILNLACHGMAVLEVYLVLWLLGVKFGLLGALVFEALTKLVNAVGSFNPGNIGTYEGGNILIAGMFGLSGAVALSVAVTRRLRAIFWAAVGGLFLIRLPKSREKDSSEDPGSTGNAVDSPKDDLQTATKSLTAVILTNNFGETGDTQSALLKVGTLPVLLRNILAIRKTGASRIIICTDSVSRRSVERELLATGRLPPSVEWLEARPDASLPQLLKQLASESGRAQMMPVAADSTYYPALFRQASEWDGEARALALNTGDDPIGIYALPADLVVDIAERCPSTIQTLDDLHAWLLSMDSVHCELVKNDFWQRIVTSGDLIDAERKLDRWLVKPTDGIFARMNRRISIPISRQLIKLPITPNVVSLLTLGVGIAAALFFACGGYWPMLIGALLSVWASILDGCDGEVARLKLLESDFGCWLETVCDYLYYLFIFAGMTIGLVRTWGTRTYLVWGALLLFGAVTSFLVTGLGRHHLATGRPEQFLRIWQANAESQQSNPILYLGRHAEFIIRRCFLPYPLLLFAGLNLTWVAFILSAVGANVVWLISLYSYCAFAMAQRSRLNNSAASG
jgi:phosphatidylglycerophosphate synthase